LCVSILALCGTASTVGLMHHHKSLLDGSSVLWQALMNKRQLYPLGVDA